MSRVACRQCRDEYEAAVQPWCPGCLARRWWVTPQLLRPKHDPDAEDESHSTYRSILTPRAKRELKGLLEVAAREGRWYFDRDYRMWVHVTNAPLGRAPGVGIPAGRDTAAHALWCLFVAEADQAATAHVFAADAERHAAQVRAGVFEPLGECESPDCPNLRTPGTQRCEAHAER